MPLATKNGSLIVKSGSLAENCSCCGGGWYCCPEPACIRDSVASISVSLTASDYLRQSRRSLLMSSGNTLNEYASVGLQGSTYNGTLSLAKQSSTVWRYDFPPQSSGACVGSLVLTWTSVSSWTLVLTYSVLSYVETNYTGVPTYKELNEMTCNSAGFFGGGAGDPNSGFPLSRGPTGTVTVAGSFSACGFIPAVSGASQNNRWSTITLGASMPISFVPAFPPTTGTIIKQTGTNSAIISVAFA